MLLFVYLSFQSSTNFKTKAEIMKELEKFGAICDAQTSRWVNYVYTYVRLMMRVMYDTLV